MPTCATCGNDYHRAFQVKVATQVQWFDCFECAIEALAPRCAQCRCKIIGHGVERDGRDYCCQHCAGRPLSDLPLFDP